MEEKKIIPLNNRQKSKSMHSVIYDENTYNVVLEKNKRSASF